jgi:hypothetical protein
MPPVVLLELSRAKHRSDSVLSSLWPLWSGLIIPREGHWYFYPEIKEAKETFVGWLV